MYEYMTIKRFVYRFQSLKLALSFNRNELLSGSSTKWLTELSVDTLKCNKENSTAERLCTYIYIHKRKSKQKKLLKAQINIKQKAAVG